MCTHANKILHLQYLLLTFIGLNQCSEKGLLDLAVATFRHKAPLYSKLLL